MATVTRAKETVQVAFREVSKTGVHRAYTGANYAVSMALLNTKKGEQLQPLIDTKKYYSDPKTAIAEALTRIIDNPELLNEFKGAWFYPGGVGSSLDGYYHLDGKGKLTEGKGDMERTVFIAGGNKPLLLDVLTDKHARPAEERFILGAYDDPLIVAPSVVGVRVGHEVATLKIEASEATEQPARLKSVIRRNVVPVTAFGVGAIGVGILAATGLDLIENGLLHDVALGAACAGLSGVITFSIMSLLRRD